MGVDKTDYVIVGYKLPYDLKNKEGNKVDWWDDEKWLRYIEGWKDEPMTLILDGMSGEYAVFGRVLASGDYNGIDFVEIDINTINDAEVMQAFYLLFKDILSEFQRPKVFAFSHFH
jgi:hypothetical protein